MSELLCGKTEFWLEFIELYKQRPILWKCDSKVYRDRRGKKVAYTELVEKLKEIEPRCDIDLVKRKINSFRACYRRELAKAKKYDPPGAYVSQWRFFKHFSFLEKQIDDPLAVGEIEQFKHESSELDTNEHALQEMFEYIPAKPKVRRLKRKSTPSPCALSRRDEQPSRGSSHKKLKQEHDEADILGISWAFQYRNLTREQKLFAKKAIDDILFEASLETLHRNSVKINEPACVNCSTAPYIEMTPHD